jgi:hypothetical protein
MSDDAPGPLWRARMSRQPQPDPLDYQLLTSFMKAIA